MQETNIGSIVVTKENTEIKVNGLKKCSGSSKDALKQSLPKNLPQITLNILKLTTDPSIITTLLVIQYVNPQYLNAESYQTYFTNTTEKNMLLPNKNNKATRANPNVEYTPI